MNNSVRLSDIGNTYGGLTGKSKTDFGRGDATYVTFMEVISNSRLTEIRSERVVVKKTERQNRIFRGDLLFNGSSETPEEVALSTLVDFQPNPGTYLNSFCFGYRIHRRIIADPAYLAYFFRSSAGRKLVASLAQGATRYNIAKTKFLELEVNLPDIERQREIATSIEAAEKLAATIERLIAKKLAIRAGMMQQLLTGEKHLPGFTTQWKETRLGDHVEYIKNVALSRAQLDCESPLRYLHYGDIHTSEDTRLSAATADMPRAAASMAGSAELLKVGDVVFADASEDPAGVGKSVEVMSVPDHGVVPGLHTIAARFDKNVLADGFKAYLQFIPEFRKSLLRLAAGTKVLATTRAYISSISLRLPGVDEQNAIACVLRDADDEIDALQDRLAKARKIKQGMMQELLTGRTCMQHATVSA